MARLRSVPDRRAEYRLQAAGYALIAGIDEAGRGPLAHKVVAAAVILPARFRRRGIDDSKRLSATKREQLAALIKAEALAWAIGEASVAEIDELNILQATRLAALRAVRALDPAPHALLLDALLLDVELPQLSMVRADAQCLVVAAASILAKVHRDHLMQEAELLYPGYGFAQHKGYPTREHLAALHILGPSPIHRRTFAPVRALLHTYNNDTIED